MSERRGVLRRVPWVEIEVDAQLRVTEWSPRAEQAFAAERAAAIGRPIAELVAVAGGEASWRRVLSESDADEAWSLADGRVFAWQHACLFDADGRVCGAVCHGREVTTQAAADRLARRDQAILRVVHQTLGMVLWAIDTRGTFVIQCGRAAMVPEGSLVGQNILTLYGSGDGEAIRAALRGEPDHGVSSQYGKDWESWMIPVQAEAPTDVAVVGISLDVSEATARERELRDKLELIERQQRAIRSMSTPIIEVWDKVLCLPILGMVDSVRTAEIMDSLLQAVTRVRARFAILDMTGVEVVDTSTAGHLLGLVRAIELLGATGIITGIHPDIAQTMVALGLDLSRIVVHANLREALKHCLLRQVR
jgi:rsbT co-antagonist protein RsbR